MARTTAIALLLSARAASYTAPRRRHVAPVCPHQRRSVLTRYAADAETEEDVQHIITCGSCKAVYAIDKEILGKGAGAKVQCEVCGNVWFQATARVNTLFDGFELKEYDAEKAQEAIDKQKARAKEAADRPPRKRGAATLFVANLPFRYSDDDVVALFAEVAPITSAQVVMDDDGRSRGYGFVEVVPKSLSRRVSPLLNRASRAPDSLFDLCTDRQARRWRPRSGRENVGGDGGGGRGGGRGRGRGRGRGGGRG